MAACSRGAVEAVCLAGAAQVRHDLPRPPTLRQIRLSIVAGEIVAFVGPNGAGKNTLGHLLMRLHHPSSGRITVDGVDIAGASLAVVPQHVLLFNATVREAFRGRTVLLITHRPASLAVAHRIVRLADGTIVPAPA